MDKMEGVHNSSFGVRGTCRVDKHQRIHHESDGGEEWYKDVPFTDLRMEFSDAGFVK
jgi:hypothetical protein